MDVPEILPAIDVHNHCGLDLGRVGVIPKKKFFSIASEGDFYKMSHRYVMRTNNSEGGNYSSLTSAPVVTRLSRSQNRNLLSPLSESQELLPAAADQLLRTEFSQLLEMPIERLL